MSDVNGEQRPAGGVPVDDDTPTIEAQWWAHLRLTVHRVRHPSLLRDIARERPFDSAVWIGLLLLFAASALVHLVPALFRFQVTADLVIGGLLLVGIPVNIWHVRRARRAANAGADTPTSNEPGR